MGLGWVGGTKALYHFVSKIGARHHTLIAPHSLTQSTQARPHLLTYVRYSC
jgi:hypothetical protein